MSDLLAEIKFWSQIVGDAKRTIICNPDHESRIKTWIDARGMGGILTVAPNPHCPPDRTYIADERGE